MGGNPKVSVLTVVRNCQDTIGQALDSVARQSYPNIEHVVQDGASTDATREMIARVASPLVDLVSEPDRGVYDGFNRAIARARGDVVGFLNGDDFFETEDSIGAIARRFEDPGVDMVFGDVCLVRPDDTSRVVRYYDSSGFCEGSLRRGIMPAHPTLYVRRALFERAGGYDPSYRIAGDFEWVARSFARAHPTYRYVPQPLVRMRLGGLSTSGLKATVRITREIRRACRENGIPTHYGLLLSRFPGKVLEFLRRRGRSAG